MKQGAGAGFAVAVAVVVAAMRIGAGTGAKVQEVALSLNAPTRLHTVGGEKKSRYRGGCTAYDADSEGGQQPKDPIRGSARAVLDGFFRLDSKQETGPQLLRRSRVRYVVTLVPDPRHTNLSLMFDRAMVMTQQAAQDEGYSYNSAWLPWSTDTPKFPLWADQLAADDDASHREACPGLLLFRKSVSFPSAAPRVPLPEQSFNEAYDEGLVVLVVGEQPTGGINEDQWANAIQWLNENASVQEDGAKDKDGKRLLQDRTLRILGPAFSGSLVSLYRDLESIYQPPVESAPPTDEKEVRSLLFPNRRSATVVLSGGVSNCSLVRWFSERIEESPRGARASFGTFNENDELHIDRFLRYLRDQGTKISDVAVLSEDETAYGWHNGDSAEDISASSGCGGYEKLNQPLRLSYPRDISALRSAYEKQSVFRASGSPGRASHPILREGSGVEDESSTAADTIPAFSGEMAPVSQEAVLYGIVSYLRAHRTRYLVLRCTNPLDNLFLTRFFHRAYPEARVVTVASDLLFRREIDTTEFRGVLALSSYPLLPRNQHWARLSEKDSVPLGHTHRTFEYNIEGIYLAGRYLFDFRRPLDVQGVSGKPITLPFKENLPDYGDPFWLHAPGDALDSVHPPTWLATVGRDGYWPIAVLNDETTPASGPKRVAASPSSTMVQLRRTAQSGPHYDLDPVTKTRFNKLLLFRLPFPWQVGVFCALLLLLYQSFSILWGKEFTSAGLFAPFRLVGTPSQGILLGINSAFAFAISIELLLIGFTLPEFGDLFGGTQAFGIIAVVACVAALVFLYRRDLRNTGIAAASFILTILCVTLASHFAIGASLNRANLVPFFYRLGHLDSGVSPFVPILFLLSGFYLWTWQAMAGNTLLCSRRPILPSLAGVKLSVKRYSWRYWYYCLLGIRTDVVGAGGGDILLKEWRFYRISHAMEQRIVKIASPLCLSLKVTVIPILFGVAALWFFHDDPPLLGLEGLRFAALINLALLAAFLLTTAESLRLFHTWHELRRLLAALSRLRLRRTFAKLRAVDANSLWSVSGNVQRIQVHFFSQQLDAATRLAGLKQGDRPSVLKALASGRRFAAISSRKIESGARWEETVRRLARPQPAGMNLGPAGLASVKVAVREDFNDAVADVINSILVPHWNMETSSLSLENASAMGEDKERNVFEMELSDNLLVRTAEEFVCFHYIAFIQNILARMRTMILSMVLLFVAVCFAISFYPFVPRTQIGMWMMLNLVLIGSSVIYVYAALERDETLSYIANTRPGQLSPEFWIKTAGFLAGPVIGLLTTQFPSIAESVAGWLQPGLDAIK